jgi:cytochrome c oxidase cbb3-type subunit 3
MEKNNKEIEVSADEKRILLDHDYDGIMELDHPLPSWWKATFWLTIIFAIPYFIYYVVMDGPSVMASYKMSREEILKVQQAYLDKLGEFKQEHYLTFEQSPEMRTYGKNIYEQNCMACHAKEGAGEIGPNLTDKYWMFAQGTPDSFFGFILGGNPIAGMPAWGTILSEDDLYAVTAYIMSIQGKEHANPKEPEGEPYERYTINE